ncbi:DUF2189 domain-containing protein [Chitinivorax sp. B]|uniref:DUF2189 domain-containing protein n=1 Tax=Chitinivorax sp. B TaxID=2502235 RepID=UPI0010FA57F7|nr:DUF2189 domain-containing protein [Chitinivorax sp. B]
MQDTLQPEQTVPSFPTIRNVPMQEPFKWLALAWRDFRNAPFPCLFYGLIFSLMGVFLHRIFVAAPHQTITLVTGFMLLGPFLAMGLYETSRRLEMQEAVSLLPTLSAWRQNLSGIGLFAMILALMFAGWMRVSVVVFALFYTDQIPTLDSMLSTTFFTEDNLPFLLVYFGSGFIFAALVFAISVVSIPMLLDRDGDTLIAIFTSSLAMWRNPAAMLVWGLIIVACCIIGFVTYYTGLILTMPLIGLASWHAYRDIVAR